MNLVELNQGQIAFLAIEPNRIKQNMPSELMGRKVRLPNKSELIKILKKGGSIFITENENQGKK